MPPPTEHRRLRGHQGDIGQQRRVGDELCVGRTGGAGGHIAERCQHHPRHRSPRHQTSGARHLADRGGHRFGCGHPERNVSLRQPTHSSNQIVDRGLFEHERLVEQRNGDADGAAANRPDGLRFACRHVVGHETQPRRPVRLQVRSLILSHDAPSLSRPRDYDNGCPAGAGGTRRRSRVGGPGWRTHTTTRSVPTGRVVARVVHDSPSVHRLGSWASATVMHATYIPRARPTQEGFTTCQSMTRSSIPRATLRSPTS